MNSFKKTLTLLFSVLLFGIWGCSKDADPIPKNKIEIGAILSLTGNWSTLGVTSQAAIEMAVKEVNESFSADGSPFELALTVYDSELKPSLASSHFNEIIRNGGKFILGPQSSSELADLKPLADEAASALIISHGSTAGSLAIANDAIFRFCPADKLEGAAIAKTMKQQGIKAIVTMARNDDGNKGLQKATAEAFVEGGGDAHSIEPYAETQTNFLALISTLKEQITQYSDTYGAANVGVYLASFDECVQLFKQASSDSLLSAVRWYGSDGVAHSTALIGDSDAASFAEKTSYFAPSFGLPGDKESVWGPLSNEIKDKTGMDADAFTLAAYDAVHVIGKTVKSLGDKADLATLDALKAEFLLQAGLFSGATGSTKLNEYGDRQNGNFDYWGIRKSGNAYEWIITGKSE